MTNEDISKEAKSFDDQIEERIKHGYLPDLQKNKRNEWFENNIWRDPFYVDLFYGKIISKIKDTISKNFKTSDKINILEIGCGPGYVCLELAREGFNVTGIDISSRCINVAAKTSQEDDVIKKNKNITYVCKNIWEYENPGQYDLVLFCNSLHHFENLKDILKKVDLLLKKDGIVFVYEPTREDMNNFDILTVYLIRSLLSLGNIYFEDIPVPKDDNQFLEEMSKIRCEFSYKDKFHKNLQSPFDNASSFKDMYKWLKSSFVELEIVNNFSFFDRIVGGIRAKSVEDEEKIAKFIYDIDNKFCSIGMTPKQFTFIGKKYG